jgi:hypothetical protein
MPESFGVVDVGAGKAWRFAEKAVAVRLPPDAPEARAAD